MSGCPACNGMIGRDCWNPQECQQITNEMQRTNRAEAQDEQPDITPYTEDLKGLKAAMQAEAQDEGAAGYEVEFHAPTMVRVRRAHPSPTPAADADRVRIAVKALEPFAHIASHVGLPKDDTVHVTALDGQWIATVRREDFWNARQALAALKSTAAKEGGAL